mgnify:CR=1 FL=1
MAQQPLQKQPLKWKLGSRCDLFVRSEMKWATGEVIGLFTDEQGEWVKVRCGQRVHDVLAHDPDLRVLNTRYVAIVLLAFNRIADRM